MSRMRWAGAALGSALFVSACGGGASDDGSGQGDAADPTTDTSLGATAEPTRSAEDYMDLLPRVDELPFSDMSLEDETWIGEEQYEPEDTSSSEGLMGCTTRMVEPLAELSSSTTSREFEGEADEGFVMRMVSIGLTSVPDGNSVGVVESIASNAERCGEYVDPSTSEMIQQDNFDIAEGPNAVGTGICTTMTTEFQSGMGSQPTAVQTCVTESSGDVLTVLFMEVDYRDMFEGDALDAFDARGTEVVDVAVEKAGFAG